MEVLRVYHTQMLVLPRISLLWFSNYGCKIIVCALLIHSNVCYNIFSACILNILLILSPYIINEARSAEKINCIGFPKNWER